MRDVVIVGSLATSIEMPRESVMCDVIEVEGERMPPGNYLVGKGAQLSVNGADCTGYLFE